MDNNIRIQDDLYTYVNQQKLEELVIPDDLPAIGGFMELYVEVEKTMMDEFARLEKSHEKLEPNMAKAIALYSIIKDVKKRNKQGIKPILKDLHFIQSTNNIALFNRRLKAFVLNGYPLPLSISTEPDFKNPKVYSLFVGGPRTILPDVTMYDPNNPQKDMLLNMWQGVALQALNFTDLSDEEKTLYVKDALEFDAIIATLVKSSEEESNYVAMYNPMRTGRVNGLVKPFRFKSTLNKIFGFIPETTIVSDVRFLKGFKTLFNEENFTKYLHWAYIKFFLQNGSYLSEDIRNVSGAFQRALTGVQKMTDVDKFAYQLASGIFSEPVGYFYGVKFFGEEAKKDVTEMVHEIIDAYKERIAENDILEQSTKDKAILKLNNMKIKMGYPDKVNPLFDQFIVDKKYPLFKIVRDALRLELLDKIDKFTKPVDKNEWRMPGHMVNACFDPFNNDITFPAAILQPPFYSIKQSRSQNLGGIGAVIGHEISHAFDNNGAKFDENGGLANWWTKKDFKNFEKKTKLMIQQFEGIELPWGKVNSNLIVSENIADNGGVAVTLHIMKKMKDANYQEYFENWGRIWCLKAHEQYLGMLLVMDVHGPSILRANMPPRNFEEWYETFNVKSTDKMFIKPSKRVVIW